MAPTPECPPIKLLRPTEAAKALGLHPQHLANLRHRGSGPAGGDNLNRIEEEIKWEHRFRSGF